MASNCTSTRTEIRRHPERARSERSDLEGVLDQALICHVGFVVDGAPVVIPTIHARDGAVLYLHGSPASRMLRSLAGGIDVCVTATLLDEVVLAKSWMHHSLNYRSAVIFGRASPVDDADTKLAALRIIVEHVQRGRAAQARPPSDKELAGTLVLSVPLEEWSVKARVGPPLDDEADAPLSWWAGVLPVPAERLGGAPA